MSSCKKGKGGCKGASKGGKKCGKWPRGPRRTGDDPARAYASHGENRKEGEEE